MIPQGGVKGKKFIRRKKEGYLLPDGRDSNKCPAELLGLPLLTVPPLFAEDIRNVKRWRNG
jgi:hypothetical protein